MEEKTVIEINPKNAEIVTESINSELRQTIFEQISKKKCQKLDIVLRDVIISECELRQEFEVEEIKFGIIGMQKILEQSIPTIEEIAKKKEKEEHRHLIKEKDGTFREETDEEFKNRLTQKYLDTDEQMHEYSEWQADYAEMQAEWYADNM